MEAERLARRQKALEAQQAQTGTQSSASTSRDGSVQDAAQSKEAHHLKQSWKLHQSPKKRKAEDDIIVIASDDADTDTDTDNKDAKINDNRANGGGDKKGKVARGPSTLSAHLPYAKGVVKKTWVRGQPRNGDDVTIDEVWQKKDLELAVLSSFQWDEEWMVTHLDLRRTRILLIAFAADDRQKEQMKANASSGNIRFCFPPMQTMGHMHSKLQLLKFPGHLRLAVPTGNLVPYDWGEAGTLENGVDAAMVQSLANYDFSEAARYAFVHSIAGSHMNESWKRTGYSGLGRAVQAMGWASSKPVQADYIAASIGSVSDDLVNALYYACQGTICFQKKWWDSPTFPHTILRDVQSVRNGVLLHTKLLLVRTGVSVEEPTDGQAARPRGWAYVGSANMSESAWGRIVKDRATGKTKMTCRNWECGVLVPTDDETNRDSTLSSSMGEDAHMLDVFRRTLPVPVVVPGAKYSSDASGAERKKPWFFLES
ncbi:hypothetical protein SCUCBS95973_001888 [Sporothrix curviconia]|uniref:Tyrosyl-DNA phosphodiesterase 1 n=1 Tax=Sporothrix curviconia TaxID=1260050 RepID=A0ABP0B2C3_9PEZI